MAAITICYDFGAQKNKVTDLPTYKSIALFSVNFFALCFKHRMYLFNHTHTHTHTLQWEPDRITEQTLFWSNIPCLSLSPDSKTSSFKPNKL